MKMKSNYNNVLRSSFNPTPNVYGYTGFVPPEAVGNNTRVDNNKINMGEGETQLSVKMRNPTSA